MRITAIVIEHDFVAGILSRLRLLNVIWKIVICLAIFLQIYDLLQFFEFFFNFIGYCNYVFGFLIV